MKQLLLILMLVCASVDGYSATYANNYTTNSSPPVISINKSNYMRGTNIFYNTEPTVPLATYGTYDIAGSGNIFNSSTLLYSGALSSSRVWIRNFPNISLNSQDCAIDGFFNVIIGNQFSTNYSAHGGGIIGGKFNSILGDGSDTGGESNGILFGEHSLFNGDNSQSVMLGGIWNIVGDGTGGGGLVTIIGSSNQLTQVAPAAIIAIGFGLRTTNAPGAGTDAGNSYSSPSIEIGVDFNKRLRIEDTNIWLFGLTLNTPTLLNATLLGTNYAETLIPTNTYFGTAYFSNGYASFSTASATIAATGWTNIWSTNNAMVRVTATATTITVKQRDDSTLDTLTTFSGTVYIPLQPGQAITAASGLAGKAVAQ